MGWTRPTAASASQDLPHPGIRPGGCTRIMRVAHVPRCVHPSQGAALGWAAVRRGLEAAQTRQETVRPRQAAVPRTITRAGAPDESERASGPFAETRSPRRGAARGSAPRARRCSPRRARKQHLNVRGAGHRWRWPARTWACCQNPHSCWCRIDATCGPTQRASSRGKGRSVVPCRWGMDRLVVDGGAAGRVP